MDTAKGSLRNLNWLIFLIAGMQAGFGPFVPVHLTAGGWDPRAIGAVLSAGTIAAVAAQVPSGAVIDHFASKRGLAACAILVTMVALLLLAVTPSFGPVMFAEIVQGAAGAGISLSIPAITLSLSHQDVLGERLGRNVRFGGIGVAVGSLLLGLVGNFVSDSAVFLMAAALGVPALLALRGIAAADLASAHERTGHHTAPPPRKRRSPQQPVRQLLQDHRLVALLGCVFLFQLGNAELLPLVATEFASKAGSHASLLAAAASIVAQLLAALLSPWIGAAAEHRGRRTVAILGLAAVPLRAVLFAASSSLAITLAVQSLDGVSAATIGVMTPLVVADLTHRGGRFNLVLGVMGLASAAGASLSTAAGGAIADLAGLPVAFLALAAAGSGAVLVILAWLPETAHLPAAVPPQPSRGMQPVTASP